MWRPPKGRHSTQTQNYFLKTLKTSKNFFQTDPVDEVKEDGECPLKVCSFPIPTAKGELPKFCGCC